MSFWVFVQIPWPCFVLMGEFIALCISLKWCRYCCIIRCKRMFDGENEFSDNDVYTLYTYTRSIITLYFIWINFSECITLSQWNQLNAFSDCNVFHDATWHRIVCDKFKWIHTRKYGRRIKELENVRDNVEEAI